jgi:hypothetical protein
MIPCETIGQIAVWKNAELQSYCCTFVRRGLNMLAIGIPYFGSDDMPEGYQPISHAVPGCAISILRSAHVISDYFGNHPQQGIYNGRRTSKRKLANGRKVNLFQITSRVLAEEFLIRNRVPIEPIQMEMAI